MRTISYRVSTENGNEFVTTNYKEAKIKGNYIEEAILTEVDKTTKKAKAEMSAHADKVKAKKGWGF